MQRNGVCDGIYAALRRVSLVICVLFFISLACRLYIIFVNSTQMDRLTVVWVYTIVIIMVNKVNYYIQNRKKKSIRNWRSIRCAMTNLVDRLMWAKCNPMIWSRVTCTISIGKELGLLHVYALFALNGSLNLSTWTSMLWNIICTLGYFRVPVLNWYYFRSPHPWKYVNRISEQWKYGYSIPEQLEVCLFTV